MNLEADAMDLLGGIIESYSLATIADLLKEAVKSFFKRMFQYKTKTRSKMIPKKFVEAVFVFFSRYMIEYSIDTLWNVTDEVQDNILNNLLEKEADCIGNILAGKSVQFAYRPHIFVAFTQMIVSLSSTPIFRALPSIWRLRLLSFIILTL